MVRVLLGTSRLKMVVSLCVAQPDAGHEGRKEYASQSLDEPALMSSRKGIRRLISTDLGLEVHTARRHSVCGFLLAWLYSIEARREVR